MAGQSTKELIAEKEAPTGFLATVERVGNMVPHPAIIFFILIGIVIVLSVIFGLLGTTVTYEGYDSATSEIVAQTATVQNLLSPDGIRVEKPGKFTKMVEAVEHVTFSGARAREQGQEVLYVTERCVMRLGDGGLVATEIMPGIDPSRDIVGASGGRVTVAGNATVLPVSLLAEGPMGWTP